MNQPEIKKIPRAPLRVLQVNSMFSGGGTDNQTLELAAGLHNCGDKIILSIPAGSRWNRSRENLPSGNFSGEKLAQERGDPLLEQIDPRA